MQSIFREQAFKCHCLVLKTGTSSSEVPVNSLCWRRRVGIEPTRRRITTAQTGFEVRATHQDRSASLFSFFTPCCSLHEYIIPWVKSQTHYQETKSAGTLAALRLLLIFLMLLASWLPHLRLLRDDKAVFDITRGLTLRGLDFKKSARHSKPAPLLFMIFLIRDG